MSLSLPKDHPLTETITLCEQYQNQQKEVPMKKMYELWHKSEFYGIFTEPQLAIQEAKDNGLPEMEYNVETVYVGQEDAVMG